MPHVRHSNRPVASSVASILQGRLHEMSRAAGSSFPSRILADHEKPTLLLLDRSDDALSPLLHECNIRANVTLTNEWQANNGGGAFRRCGTSARQRHTHDAPIPPHPVLRAPLERRHMVVCVRAWRVQVHVPGDGA